MNFQGTVLIEVGPAGSPPVNRLVLPVNPDQDFTQNYRVTVVQTYAGIYADDFAQGIKQITLSGTSAWDSPQGAFNGQPVSGNAAIRHLYKDILNFYFDKETHTSNPQHYRMAIYNNATEEAWLVKPIDSLRLTRSQSSPITVSYSQLFLVLEDLMSGTTFAKIPDPIINVLAVPLQQQRQQQQATTTQTVQKTIQKAASQSTTQSHKAAPTVTVQPGDSVWAIASRMLGANATNAQILALTNAIIRLNHLAAPYTIFPNEHLRVPVLGA